MKISLNLDADDPVDMINFEIIDVEPHPFGTYPTKEEIAKINETFIQEHENSLVKEYKLFHQIKLGLLKK